MVIHTKTKRQIRIRDQLGSLGRRYAKLLGPKVDVRRGADERGVRQEGVKRADDQDHRLLEIGPLQRIVGVLSRDRE